MRSIGSVVVSQLNLFFLLMSQVMEFFKKIFDASDWPARWYCGKWSEFHGWFYIVSDLLIWAAYFTIPLVIVKYIAKKKDLQFLKLYILFAAFILTCGATHFLDALAFWLPVYRFNALVRFITAVFSWITVFYAMKFLPIAFSLKSPNELQIEIERRKKVEEEIRNLNARLEQLFDERTAELQKSLKVISDYKYALDESSIVAITDQTGIIKHVNENFCRISKYSTDELIGQDHRIINSKHHSKEFIQNLWTTIAKGKIWKGELRNRAKDGSVYWVDTTIIPFLNEQGKPYQYIAIRADITERKIGEEALRRSENRFRKIFDSRMIGFLFYDYDGSIIEANDSFLEMVGYTQQDIAKGNVNLINMTPPEFADVDQRARQQIELSGVSLPLEKEYIRKDGNRIPVLICATSIEDNAPVKNVAYIMDITERKKAEQEIKILNDTLEKKVLERTAQLELANKELEAFSYSVSHDLRAPLRAVNGYARMLEEDYQTFIDENGKRLLHVIQQNAKTMGVLIDDLLAFSRLGRKEIQRSPINMTELVKSIVTEIRDLINHKAEMEIETLHDAQADPSLIRQVIMNLLLNAIKYSSKENRPLIKVTSTLTKGDVIYSIHDNGVGFDMKYAHKLFGVFQRLHTGDDFEGTGVGLAMVKRIITKHGGNVWAEGELGKGAIFYFSLPP